MYIQKKYYSNTSHVNKTPLASFHDKLPSEIV